DLCGRLFFHSNPICNIIVTVPENSELTHTIEWTPAEFLYGVENYRLMAVYGDDSANEIGYYQLEDLRVTYDIESYVRLRHARKEYVTNNYCYYIEAYENNEKIDNLSPAYAKSNIACTSHQPVVWIPNAFAPGSFVDKNKYFRPIVSFVDEYSYKMTIFDKNGLEVFSTSETTGVWDGKIKGTRAPAGIYVYRIAYSNSAGNDFEHTGILNLVY
ncbi:MAG: hypothetical protein GX879_06650, partial [Bacteroidales bacterium]|nr:hypothetical protein [Bacteroidales bacterium]